MHLVQLLSVHLHIYIFVLFSTTESNISSCSLIYVFNREILAFSRFVKFSSPYFSKSVLLAFSLTSLFWRADLVPYFIYILFKVVCWISLFCNGKLTPYFFKLVLLIFSILILLASSNEPCLFIKVCSDNNLFLL